MKQDIFKEIKYGLRNSRFLILMIGFLFFAILNPIMSKLVIPNIMKSQFPGLSEEALNEMLNLTQIGIIRAYMGDIFEIGSIIVAFTLCGLIAQEIKDNTLVLPLCSGKQFGSIVTAKLLVFGSVLILSPTVALLVNYLYAGLLFSFDISLAPIIRGGLLQGIYMVFLLACLLMWGAIIKKPIAAGFCALATGYGLSFIGGLLRIQTWIPSGLLNEAQMLETAASPKLLQTLSVTTAIILVMTAITWMRLKKMEWNVR
jgi:ABC-type transport system involved in multi-copper enzyme maturation permease subunit